MKDNFIAMCTSHIRQRFIMLQRVKSLVSYKNRWLPKTAVRIWHVRVWRIR